VTLRPTSAPRRGAAVALAVALALAGVFSHGLWTPDEPVGAAVGATMLRTGDWTVPRLGGTPFLEKPPLYWWVQAAGYRAFGVHDWVARLPSAFFMALTLLAVDAAGRLLAGPRLGLLALAVAGSTLQFSEDMGRVVVDPALVLFVFLGWCAVAWEDSSRGVRRGVSTLAIAVAAGGAFLSKGWIGPALAVAVPAAALLVRDRTRGVVAVVRLGALACAGVVALGAPWVFALWRQAGIDAVRECLVGNTAGRFFGGAGIDAYGHREPFWYYLEQAPLAAAPWILALPAAWRAARADSAVGRTLRLWLAAAGIGLVFLSVAVSKRALYLVPLLPAVSLAIAWWILRDDAAPSRIDRFGVRALIVCACGAPFLVAAAALAGAFAPLASPLAEAARRAPMPLVLALVAVLLAAVGVWATARLRPAWSAATPRPLFALVAPWVIVMMAWQLAGKWAIDPLKSLHDTTAAWARAAEPGEPLGVFSHRAEKLIAIADYDLARPPIVTSDDEAASQYFAAHPEGALLLETAQADGLRRALPLPLDVVYDERGRKATPYAVLRRHREP
jgi:4-amino-4-deoxy-L-arabinose transferase-like glycosyltransferase